MSGERPPRVVAELGRPETPEETAERKARDRVLRRRRQTFRNLLASLGVTVGLAVVIVLAVPFPSTPQQATFDVPSVAHQYQDTAGRPILAPAVPTSWRATAAELRGSGDASSWYVGWDTGGGYAGLTEGLPGTDALLDSTMEHGAATGTTTIAGLPWRVYDRRDLGSDAGNVAYGLATRIDGTLVAVYGTVSPAQVQRLAALAAADAAKRGLGTSGTLP